MRIYTSYFGNIKKIQEAGILPICIARGVPKFFHGISMQEFAPYSFMLSGNLSREEYIDNYNKILAKLNPTKSLQSIYVLAHGKDVALLCYEKPTEFCHRHLLADWLEKATGQKIEEFGVQGRPWEKTDNEEIKQPCLFD